MSKSNEALLQAYKLGYRISTCGVKLQTPFNLIELRILNNDGYPIFSTRVFGEPFPISWHRLQAYQKYGERIFEKNTVVRHKNNIKTDCSWDNILIGTQKENVNDNPAEKRLKYSLNATDKWRKYNATEVKDFYKNCKSYKQTMENFEISSKGTLHFILNNAKYS
jgi:hypothetical protein